MNIHMNNCRQAGLQNIKVQECVFKLSSLHYNGLIVPFLNNTPSCMFCSWPHSTFWLIVVQLFHTMRRTLQLHVSLKSRAWKGKRNISAELWISKIDEEMCPGVLNMKQWEWTRFDHWLWRRTLNADIVTVTVLLSAPGGCKSGFHRTCQTLLRQHRGFSESLRWPGWVGGNDSLIP